MPHIYSTMSAAVEYTLYNNDAPAEAKIARAATPRKSILIEGGANVLIGQDTPVGVATQVTSEELALLKSNQVFERQLARGHLIIVEQTKAPEVKKVAKDMTARDASAPLSEAAGDFKEGGRAAGVAPKLAKIK